MATASNDEQPELSPATYAELHALELDFDSIDAIATAYQESLSQPFHKKRADLAARIPGFWPLVFEQAPPDVDQFIQPSDSAVLATCLTGFSVERFECKGGPDAFTAALKNQDEVSEELVGEPRSISLRFEFKENEWFEDKVIEKKFWFRRSLEGSGDDASVWEGRVSEPVKIHWKPGKDLSDGLTDAACVLWEAQKTNGLLDAKDHSDAKAKDDEVKKLPEYAKLVELVDKSTEGSQSFFTLFGYHGPWVSTEQDKTTRKVEKDRRTNPPSGPHPDADAEDGDEEDLDEMPTHLAVEIFPDGEELALALAEDVWPNAIKYFLEAQEDDDDEDLSAASFESADLEEMDAEDQGKANLEEIRGLSARVKGGHQDAPPAKKRKT